MIMTRTEKCILFPDLFDAEHKALKDDLNLGMSTVKKSSSLHG